VFYHRKEAGPHYSVRDNLGGKIRKRPNRGGGIGVDKKKGCSWNLEATPSLRESWKKGFNETLTHEGEGFQQGTSLGEKKLRI